MVQIGVAPTPAYDFSGIHVSNAAGDFPDLGGWMNVPMGSLYSNEFEFQP